MSGELWDLEIKQKATSKNNNNKISTRRRTPNIYSQYMLERTIEHAEIARLFLERAPCASRQVYCLCSKGFIGCKRTTISWPLPYQCN